MAGRGPAPKDPKRRARTNKEVAQLRVLTITPDRQPALPERFKTWTVDGETVTKEVGWPAGTEQWWQMWDRSPLANDFTETDWSELSIAAFLHAEFMEGNYKLAGELRLRTAKFGATPEDRMRLRITFAQAVEAGDKLERRVQSSRDRFRGISVADEMEA